MERYAGLDVSLEQALMTAPGVGVLVALTCARVTEDPQRFAKSSSVGAHAGLTPRRFQSGKGGGTGRISKHGDALRRTCVSETAGTILHRVARWSALKAWGARLAKRIGAKKATVAMARKLAGILHRMGKNGSGFRRPSRGRHCGPDPHGPGRPRGRHHEANASGAIMRRHTPTAERTMTRHGPPIASAKPQQRT